MRDDQISGVLSDASLRRRQDQADSRGGRFIKGPLPLPWLEKAAALPGKAMAVALLLWYQRGLTKSHENLVANNKLAEGFGISRKAKYRALRALEGAELVQVSHRRGANPRVTILDVRC